MNLEDKFNELLKKQPSIFQYNTKIEVAENNDNLEKDRVEFKIFNSKRKYSYPFYKPISKIFKNDL